MSQTGLNLKQFLSPTSIAIIGASSNFDSISGKPLRFLHEHGFAGKVYPVNPKYDELLGYKCYKQILDVPGEVDLALIAVNYRLVIPMLKVVSIARGDSFLMYGPSFHANQNVFAGMLPVLLTAIAMAGLTYRSERRVLRRLGFDSALIGLAYLGGMYLLLQQVPN